MYAVVVMRAGGITELHNETLSSDTSASSQRYMTAGLVSWHYMHTVWDYVTRTPVTVVGTDTSYSKGNAAFMSKENTKLSTFLSENCLSL